MMRPTQANKPDGYLGHESIKLTADTYGNGIVSLDPRANDCLDDPDWSVSLHGA